MLISLSRVLLSPFVITFVLAGAAARAAPPVEFQRDIQPILAEHCAQCHGADAANRKSGLRLDVHESALKGGDSGAAAIVPGQPEESELIQRVSSSDPDFVIPPPRHQKALSVTQ